MKKITLCLMLIFAMLIVPVAIFAEENDVAKIGDTGYATLADAVAAVPKDNTQTKITLLKSVEDGPGIVVNDKQNIVIDFNGFSYDASKPTVGSEGTKTISLQILKGSTVTLKNGTLTSKTAKRIIQDYSDLTLENMVIDGTKSSNNIGYVISFINGKVNVTGNTSILATEGNYAFDNYFWPEYGYTDGAKVTINTTGTIKGDIELASSEKGLEKTLPSTLTIKNVKHDGHFNFVDERFEEGFTVEGGSYIDLGSVVKGINKEEKEVTIKLLRAVEEGSGIVVNNKQNVVIDFNGFSYDASNPTVGSEGTKTISLQILKGSKVTLKNGTLTSKKAKRIIQDYSDLTLENMVIDGTKSVNEIGYVISFINGKANITGNTSILAKEGKCAFDNYFWPEYGYTDGAKVTINTTGTIKGDIELASSTKGIETTLPSTLTIHNVEHEGTFKIVDERFKNAFTVKGGVFSTDVKEYLADGLICPKIEDVYVVASAEANKINVKNVEGGTVKASKETAQFGDIIKLTVDVKEGYKLKSLEVVSDGGLEDVSVELEFMMPRTAVEINPVFEKLTTDAEIPNEVANEKEVEEMLIETLKELSKDPDVAAKLEGKNIEVEVKVNAADKTITDSEKSDIEKEAAKKVEDLKVASYLDITIIVKDAKTDEKLTTMPEVKEAITFTVAVPEGLPEVAEGYTRVFYIIRNHNGNIDVWETKEVDGKLSFESDKFSTYAIAYKDVENSAKGEDPIPEVKPEDKPVVEEEKTETPDVPKTGDNVILYVALAAIAVFGIVRVKKVNTSKRKH